MVVDNTHRQCQKTEQELVDEINRIAYSVGIDKGREILAFIIKHHKEYHINLGKYPFTITRPCCH